ncbi:MAG TPA: C-type lectin domain-containing protein [Polyangiaceae bacterium]|jgi:hypothetical protein|nr:C-type lectin domain-containing protein [Polyangiaceae bacterium]
MLLFNRFGFPVVAALLFGSAACGSPPNNGLFSSAAAGSASTGAGGSASQANGGGVNASGSTGTASGGSSGLAASAGTGTAGDSSAGSGNGGSSNAGASSGGFSGGGALNGGSSGSAESGGANGGSGGSTVIDCSRYGDDATYFSDTGHCYLVMHDDADFADARMHCSNLSGHLVTISDQSENDFVWGLDANEHWIGATDGKGPRVMNPGTYSWVDGEPLSYTDWSAGQPNATASTCDDSDGPGMGPCYEHCAFQWAGGDAPGEWNDRLCSHTIEAVCEWEN